MGDGLYHLIVYYDRWLKIERYFLMKYKKKIISWLWKSRESKMFMKLNTYIKFQCFHDIKMGVLNEKRFNNLLKKHILISYYYFYILFSLNIYLDFERKI